MSKDANVHSSLLLHRLVKTHPCSGCETTQHLITPKCSTAAVSSATGVAGECSRQWCRRQSGCEATQHLLTPQCSTAAVSSATGMAGECSRQWCRRQSGCEATQHLLTPQCSTAAVSSATGMAGECSRQCWRRWRSRSTAEDQRVPPLRYRRNRRDRSSPWWRHSRARI